MAASPSTLLSPRDSALATLKAEHRALGKVVSTLQEMLKDIAAEHCDADFQLIATILYYLDAFPERCHHPKEDKYLFKHLRARTDQANDLLDELEAQHAESARLMAALERAFVLYQGGAPGGLAAFAKVADAYARLQWKHMDLEEERMFALAHQHLFGMDWFAIDRAFRANEDPLFGATARDEFAKLRQRIVNRLPARVKRRVRD